MILFLLSYLGGVLTILSPCILPVLPFVFARADRPFLRSGLPLLLGMAITFVLIATLATLGGAWAVQANQAGRILAMLLLAVFGLTLLLPALAERLTRPVVALGNRLSAASGNGTGGAGSSLLLVRLLGYTRAADLVLRAGSIDGTEAHRLGIVSRLAEPGAVDKVALEIAAEFASKPPQAMRRAKRLMKGDTAGLLERIREEERGVFLGLGSAEGAEALRAFREKRRPNFT